MTVYVDDMFRKATVANGGRTVTGEWCHMQADTREELDAMADKIGLRRSWIQYPDDDVKRHYDVTRPRRAAAVAAGAVEVGMLELARMRAKWRAARRATQSTGRGAAVSDAPLTPEEVRALAEGTRIIVLWSGGNGPHEYRLIQGAFGMQYACPPAQFDRPHLRERNPLESIGSEQWHTKVWLAGSSPTDSESGR